MATDKDIVKVMAYVPRPLKDLTQKIARKQNISMQEMIINGLKTQIKEDQEFLDFVDSQAQAS